ncbi:MAG: acyltransferase [Synechococcales cyanobacterium RM1_1_8]|nr:acyltransferase [Synechococcales cyanobacterium RM1_1_8]
MKPLLIELLEQEQVHLGQAQADSERSQPTLQEPILQEYVLREQLAAEIAPLVHEQLINQIRVWGDRDRLHISPTAATVNTLFNTASGQITIGDHSFTGHNVSLLTGSHDIHKQGLARMTDYPTQGRDIVIGQGVWIGSNATVLGPCTIGDHAVVAAGAVVLAGTVVPEGAIVAGVPAKVIRIIDVEVD